MKFQVINKLSSVEDLIIPIQKSSATERLKETIGLPNVLFNGDFKECVPVFGENRNTYLLGLGDDKDKNAVHEAFNSLSFKYLRKWQDSIQVDLSALGEIEADQAILGMKQAEYNIGFLKSKSSDSSDLQMNVFTGRGDTSFEGEKVGETINRIKELVDSPAGRKTPEFLANWAKESGKKYGYSTTVFDKSTLTEKGFGGVLAVGQGSVHDPRLIIQTWNPENSKTPDLVLVGKGITFDTGGLSIKPSTNLHYMKSDMGGAAAVMGTLEVLAKLGIKKHVVGIVASAENAVDANSFRPGDVIKSYGGKTVEIIDTDAEGRLVLADAISYALETYKPQQIIDLATLTGSVIRTLGYSAAGLFTNNDEIANTLSNLGESINEKVWRLPLYEEFEKDLESDIADLRNFSMKPIAGGINAAKFLQAFTENHDSWAHLDIAGVAFGDSEYAKLKSASGYGVRLLIAYIKQLGENGSR